MYDMAKKSREAMKGKARRLAGEKDQKVDSSDWSPAEPLNADIKTGMRPISRRAYKSGGKVEGECAPKNLGRKPRKAGGKAESEKAEAAEYAKAKINRNVKAANEEREGIKHIGGLKSGGRAKKAKGGMSKADTYASQGAKSSSSMDVPASGDDYVDPGTPEFYARMRGEARKSGGRAKKADGGDIRQLNRITDPAQRRRLEQIQNPPSPPKPAPARPKPAAPAMDMSTMDAEQAAAFMRSRKTGGRTARKDGGKIATTLAGQEKIQKEQAAASKPTRAKAQHYKKGGRAEKMMGGSMDPRMNMVKSKAMEFAGAQGTPYKAGGRTKKLGGGALMGGILPALAMGDMGGKKKDEEGKKAGGRIARKSGGRAKGKTNINIVIAAGKPATPDMMQGAGGPPMPPGGIPVPLPGGPQGAPPMPMGGMGAMGGMPMPPAPPAMPAPMGRKTGGRTVAKSYKDMTAGAGSGEGRLQKTEIAEGKREARKAGGKVYRSYKDMDAGAGSGLGRLEKTEIEARKN